MTLILPYGLTDPRAKVRAAEYTARLRREFDDGLEVVFDTQREKYVVMDRKAPGGPEAQYVMVIQNEDGSFRPFDQRTIDTIRKNFRHDVVKDELRRLEKERERANVSRRESVSAAFASDFQYFGKQIAPSVGWRDRSLARERIRKEANQ